MSKSKKRRRAAGRRRNITAPKRSAQGRWLPGVAVVAVILAVTAIGLLLARQGGQTSEGSAVNGAASPRLEVDQSRIDFGDVPVNQMVKASFKLSNTGDGVLNVVAPPVPEVVEGC